MISGAVRGKSTDPPCELKELIPYLEFPLIYILAFFVSFVVLSRVEKGWRTIKSFDERLRFR